MGIYLIAFILVVSLGSCGHKLHQDPQGLTAVQAEYPSAEFSACGKLWHGIGVCSLVEGQPLSKLGLEIQGYYNGSVKIDSSDCNTHMDLPYENSGKIQDFLKGVAKKSCVITFTVSPEYPRQRKQPLAVSGFRGHLRIKVLKAGDSWIGKVFRFPENTLKEWKLNVNETSSVELHFRGCNKSIDLVAAPNADGIVTLPIHSLIDGQPQTCVVEGLLQSKTYKDLLITIVISNYYSAFKELNLPKVTVVKRGLTISAEPATSVVSVGGQFAIDNKATFEVDLSEEHVVRALTVKGRSIIGTYNPAKRSVIWVLR